MSKKKKILTVLIVLLAVLSPFLGAATLMLATPSQYEHTFLGELADKVERLSSVKDPKLVLIGGSSVAFGYNSPLLEEHMGMPVVNFGLYASLGTKVMLDMAREHIGQGDIVVLAPEMDRQTLSLYFNGRSVWEAADSDVSLLGGVAAENYDEMLGSFWGYLTSKLRLLLRDGKPSPTDVYNAKNFNEYGDIRYLDGNGASLRAANEMVLGYESDSPISLTPDIVDKDFISYVNAFTREMQGRGASVYFTFSPMNAEAMSEDTTEDSLYAFYEYLSTALACPVITNPSDCILDFRYFYDSNFHLNDAGTVVRTSSLIRDLRRALGDPTPVTIDTPPPPAHAPKITVLDDPAFSLDADCFLYDRDETGLLTVVGLTEKGKLREVLTVPAMYNGEPVALLGNGEPVFAGASRLREITVHVNIKKIAARAFAFCPSIKTVAIMGSPQETQADRDALLLDTHEGIRFKVLRAYASAFAVDYYWSPYSSKLKY